MPDPHPQAPHQPTRHLSRPMSGDLHAWPTSLASSLAPGALSACHGVHRPAVPRPGQTARPGTRRQACGSSSRTGWNWAAGWPAASIASTQEPPTPPGSQGRAAVGDGVNDQGDAQQPRSSSQLDQRCGDRTQIEGEQHGVPGRSSPGYVSPGTVPLSADRFLRPATPDPRRSARRPKGRSPPPLAAEVGEAGDLRH